MKKAVVIGASSGIGRALTVKLNKDGYEVGIMARREKLLKELADELSGKVIVKALDITDTEKAGELFKELLAEMGEVELIIINSGAGKRNPELLWELEKIPVEVNVKGFTLMAVIAAEYFTARGKGHLVVVSSIAGLRGNRFSPAYSASKAYVSTYADALRHKFAKMKLAINVTDVIPGFVDTVMAQGKNVFWVAKTDVAAEQILKAVRKNKKRAYITRRWLLIGILSKIIPDFLYHKI